MREKLNLRFLGYMLASLTALSTTWCVVHALQVWNNSKAILAQADYAEEQGNLIRAARFLGQYLEAVPEDTDARVHLGRVLERLATSPPQLYQVIQVYEQVLLREPGRVDIRKQIASLAMKLRDYGRALNQLKALKESQPKDSEVWQWLGQCYQVNPNSYQAAEAAFEQAIRLDPTRIESYVSLAGLRQRHSNELRSGDAKAAQTSADAKAAQSQRPPTASKKAPTADDALNELVKNNKAAFRAYLARARFRLAHLPEIADPAERKRELTEARQDAKQAFRLAPWPGYLLSWFAVLAAPQEPEVLLVAAHAARDAAREAKNDLSHVEDGGPVMSRFLPTLKLLSLLLDEEAWLYLNRGVVADSKELRIYIAFAELQMDTRSPDNATRAIKTLRQGLKHPPDNPHDPMAAVAWASLVWTLGDLLIDSEKATDRQQARELIKTKMPDANIPRPLVDYLEARAACAEGKWAQARGELERIRPLLAAISQLAALRCDLLLGRCCEELDDTTAQLAAYRRASQADPSRPASYGAAAALLQLGKPEEAIEETRRLLQIASAENASAEIASAEILLARLLVLQNLRLGAKAPWETAVAALGQAAKHNPDSFDVSLLRCEILLAQKNPAEAGRVLRAAQLQHRQDVRVYVALADLARRQRNWKQVEQVLDQAERELGDRVELRLARARFLLDRGHAPAEALAKLGADTHQFGDQEPFFLRNLAQVYVEFGKESEAAALRNRLVELGADDVRTRLALVDYAYRYEDEEALERHLEAIRSKEGQDSARTHFTEASLLIVKGRHQADRALFDEARNHLRAAAVQEPSWTAVPLLRAQIEDEQGDQDGAVEDYLKALKPGDNQLGVIRRTIELLCQRGRYIDADLLIREHISAQTPLSPDLQSLIAQVSLRRQDDVRAREAAEKAVAAHSQNYRDYLVLARILFLANDQIPADEAKIEELLRKAVDLGKSEPEPWVALVEYLAHLKKAKELDSTIPKAERSMKGKLAKVALAQIYELGGRIADAKKIFQAAVVADSENLQVRNNAAAFYLRYQMLERARNELSKILELQKQRKEDSAGVRRVLAIALASLDYVQGNAAEAENIYRRVLGVEPDNVVALNNLAWLLAVDRDKAKEALDLINHAIAESGPLANLRDTRAVIYLALNQPTLAIADLNAALESLGSTEPRPLYHLHLARAFELAGKRLEAKASWQRANAAGLDEKKLTGANKTFFRQLAGVVAEK
jgi:tetratricopeptide (TPR) repeat protein